MAQVYNKVLRCSRCGKPFGRVQQGALLVESKHDGESHMNLITLDELLRFIRESLDAGAFATREDVGGAP